MGLGYAPVKLANARKPDLLPVEIDALADKEAVHPSTPEHVAIQLELDELDRREVALAGGQGRTVPYVGPLLISVANRSGFAGAVVVGDQVVLGMIPMEDLDLVILQATRQVVPNPANP